MALKQGPLAPNNKKPPRYNSYLRYSSLGLQLLLTLAVCGWLGHKVDQYLDIKYPVFMLLLGLIGFSGIMYQIYRSVNKD